MYLKNLFFIPKKKEDCITFDHLTFCGVNVGLEHNLNELCVSWNINRIW